MIGGYHLMRGHMIGGYHAMRNNMMGGYDVMRSQMIGGYHATRNNMIGGYHLTRGQMIGGYHRGLQNMSEGENLLKQHAAGGEQLLSHNYVSGVRLLKHHMIGGYQATHGNLAAAEQAWHDPKNRGTRTELLAISAAVAAGAACGGNLACAYAAYDTVKGYEEGKENGASDLDSLRYAARRGTIGYVKGAAVQYVFSNYISRALDIKIVAFSIGMDWVYFKLAEIPMNAFTSFHLDDLAGETPDEEGDDDLGIFNGIGVQPIGDEISSGGFILP